ncbi:pentapeptide repeat-containing protein [Actinoplanes aureus]|uniref:pentapeptide repeat-containing protein n=1 Tax=Actinoplanes aureus TaxID=2792083 RepID=UPI00281677D0|nr:pentapeptide repeat-containing protein [Actinoplanes aureus]
MSVLLVAVGLYLTNDYNRDQYRLQQGSTRQQQDLALKGQRADRFVKAIDQLGQEGDDKLSIRLGGVYALETLMRESVDDRDTVIEVLCAFIRTHAPRPDPIPKTVPTSPEDVRAAISVLGRRLAPQSHRYLNLSGTLLGLRQIDLRSTALRSTDLSDADLSDADLSGADLSGADLSDADLVGADVRGADLVGADLRGADLVGAELRFADLSAADLIGADLRATDLSDADLSDAVLSPANLSGAYLPGADLSGADLSNADLRGAYLRGADLTAADLVGADLRAADLGDAVLSGTDLACTAMDQQTKLPPGTAHSDPKGGEGPGCQR